MLDNTNEPTPLDESGAVPETPDFLQRASRMTPAEEPAPKPTIVDNVDVVTSTTTTTQPESPPTPTLDQIGNRTRQAVANYDRTKAASKKAAAASKDARAAVGVAKLAAAIALYEAQNRVFAEDKVTWKQWLTDNKIDKSEGYVRRLIAIAKAPDPAAALAASNAKAAAERQEDRDKKGSNPERTNGSDVGPHPAVVDPRLIRQITQLSVRFAELLGPINDRDTLVEAFAIFDRTTEAVRSRADLGKGA